MGLLLLVEEMGGLLHQHKVILNTSPLNEANWLVETISCNLFNSTTCLQLGEVVH
jgi:hypothetical protein